jgi:4-hydroxy-2-oxoheptanedioate aldolase
MKAPAVRDTPPSQHLTARTDSIHPKERLPVTDPTRLHHPVHPRGAAASNDPTEPRTLIERRQRAMYSRHRDGVSFGLHLSFLSPELVEFCGVLGFQWLFLDAQRTPVTPALSRDLVRAADLTGLFCVARVTRVDAAEIEAFLDAGVLGILAPAIENAAQAEALVAAVKFAPQGRRGASWRSRAAGYGVPNRAGWAGSSPFSIAGYYAEANQATFTAALIETEGGIERLEEIMAVPGLDYIALGPNDLALALGACSGDEPRIQALVADARTRLQVAGKPQIAVVADSQGGKDAAAGGATLIAVSDASLMSFAGSLFLEGVSL